MKRRRNQHDFRKNSASCSILERVRSDSVQRNSGAPVRLTPKPAQPQPRGLLDGVVDLFSSTPEESDAPLSQKMVDRALKRYRGNFRRAVEADRDLPTPLVQFDRLLRAKEMADDPEHKLADRIDRPKLQQKWQEITSDETLQTKLNGLRVESVEQAGATRALQEQKGYLTGAEFHHHLTELDPQQAAEVMAKELGKVAALDPEASQEVTKKILEESAAQALHHLKKSDRSTVTEGLIAASTASQLPTLSEDEAEVVADLLLKAENLGDLADAGSKVSNLASGLRKHGVEQVNKALGWVSRADQAGVLSSVVVGASLVTAFTNDLETRDDKVQFASDLIQAGGSVSQMTHLPFLAGALQHGQIADVLLTTSQVIGPVGTALSTVVSSYGAIKALEEGDTGKAAGNGLIATGSALMLSAVFFPAAAPFLLVGAGTSLTGLAVTFFGAKNPDETLLEKAGLLKDEPK